MDIFSLYFLVVMLLGQISPSIAEYCEEYVHGPNGHTTRTIHCSFGCCGDYRDQYCCVSSTGFIVGLVFAGIFTISVITAIVCCCIKHKGQRGRVIQPSATYPNQSVFIVPATGPAPPAYVPEGNNTMPPQPPAYYPSQFGYNPAMPPAYSSSSAPPPAYSAEEPKYPPQTQNPYGAAAGRQN